MALEPCHATLVEGTNELWFAKTLFIFEWGNKRNLVLHMNDIIQLLCIEFTYLVGTKLVGMGCLSLHTLN